MVKSFSSFLRSTLELLRLHTVTSQSYNFIYLNYGIGVAYILSCCDFTGQCKCLLVAFTADFLSFYILFEYRVSKLCCETETITESEEGKIRYRNLEDKALMIRKAVLEGKVGHLCHFVMTGCVSPLGTLPHSSGETDTDTGKGTVTSLTRLLGL